MHMAKFGHFLELKKHVFFFLARALPSKLVYFGAKGAFRKILGSVRQKRISQNSTMGKPFGSTGGRIPEKGQRPPHPKSAPENLVIQLT